MKIRLVLLLSFILGFAACSSSDDVPTLQQQLFSSTVWKGKIDMDKAILPPVIDKSEQHYYILRFDKKNNYTIYLCDSNGVNVLFDDAGTCEYVDNIEEGAKLRFHSKTGNGNYTGRYSKESRKLFLENYGVNMYKQ